MTLFRTKAEAEQIANQNQNDDPDWAYRIKPSGPWFLVIVYDENGIYLGSL